MSEVGVRGAILSDWTLNLWDLRVDSVRIEMNFRISSWYNRIAWWYGETPTHQNWCTFIGTQRSVTMGSHYPFNPKGTGERKQNYLCGLEQEEKMQSHQSCWQREAIPATTWNQNSKRQGIKYFNLPVFPPAAVCWHLQLGKLNLKSESSALRPQNRAEKDKRTIE